MLKRMKNSILLALLTTLLSCVTNQPQYYHPDATVPDKSSFTRAKLNNQPEEKIVLVEPEPEAYEKLDQYARNWFYGQGLGNTMTNAGTVVIFPPYAFYVLGNAGLSLMGYEPLYITNALPEDSRKPVLKIFNGVTSVPGRINAKVAGEDFQGIDE